MKNLKRLHWVILFAALLFFAAATPVFSRAEDWATFDFPGEFLASGSEPIRTDTNYQSENVHITVTISFDEALHSDVTVADIYVRSLECFRRIYGMDTFQSKKLNLKKIVAATSGILYMNGDGADGFKVGLAAGNGIIWRSKHNNMRDVCVILRDGTMYCYTPRQMMESGLYSDLSSVWHGFLFGPCLLKENGTAYTAKKEFTTKEVFVSNPRSAIGYYEPGHYCFVTVGGRHTSSVTKNGKKNQGADLCELSALMERLGCVSAYNLDGGQSSQMWFNGNFINSLYNNGRGIGDALIICEPGSDVSLTD